MTATRDHGDHTPPDSARYTVQPNPTPDDEAHDPYLPAFTTRQVITWMGDNTHGDGTATGPLISPAVARLIAGNQSTPNSHLMPFALYGALDRGLILELDGMTSRDRALYTTDQIVRIDALNAYVTAALLTIQHQPGTQPADWDDGEFSADSMARQVEKWARQRSLVLDIVHPTVARRIARNILIGVSAPDAGIRVFWRTGVVVAEMIEELDWLCETSTDVNDPWEALRAHAIAVHGR